MNPVTSTTPHLLVGCTHLFTWTTDMFACDFWGFRNPAFATPISNTSITKISISTEERLISRASTASPAHPAHGWSTYPPQVKSTVKEAFIKPLFRGRGTLGGGRLTSHNTHHPPVTPRMIRQPSWNVVMASPEICCWLGAWLHPSVTPKKWTHVPLKRVAS